MPDTPVVMPLLFAATILVAGFWWMAHAYAKARADRPAVARPPRCPACGYDLRATPEVCPECGTFFPVRLSSPLDVVALREAMPADAIAERRPEPGEQWVPVHTADAHLPAELLRWNLLYRGVPCEAQRPVAKPEWWCVCVYTRDRAFAEEFAARFRLEGAAAGTLARGEDDGA